MASDSNILVGHTRGVTSVAFSQDGKHIASGSYDRTVRIWDAETGDAVTGPLLQFALKFAPDPLSTTKQKCRAPSLAHFAMY